ncbi:MAG: AmmeMemoRadiSam system protein B [Chloroflexi bacterium]|nr:AmmeMemoRadiSam system protein B [Chloroflexota bacterium]
MQQPIIPQNPQLRPVEPHWVDHEGQRYLYLKDPLNMSDLTILLPQQIASLVMLMDGEHSLSELRIALQQAVGITVTEDDIRSIVSQLDQALMIENGSYVAAAQQALDTYRNSDSRPSSHAGLVYPEKPDDLAAAIAEYCAIIDPPQPRTANGNLVGMLCPHIDYDRGHNTYAALWEAAKPDLSDIELVIILGTDHMGGLGKITPTRQSYATPYGSLPTDTEIVDRVAAVLGLDTAFDEEIHHANEHSIELASVWLHHYTRDLTFTVVPILCGSFHHFVSGEGHPGDDENITTTIEVLKEFMAQRRTLVISAGDLAHVGPAFGDAVPLDVDSRAKLKSDDAKSIEALLKGDASRFFEISKDESDARRICGLPPTYLMLRLLEGATGESFGYDQCPADDENGSAVSIVGALLYDG